MSEREIATEYLRDGMDLLKAHGLFGKDEHAHTFAMERALTNLRGQSGAPEIAAGLQALFEAKRLITARSSIAGKRIVMGDWFVSLAVSLALPLRNAALTSLVSRELCKVGEDVSSPLFSASKAGYLKTVDEVCACVASPQGTAPLSPDCRIPRDIHQIEPLYSAKNATFSTLPPPAYERLIAELSRGYFTEAATASRFALERTEGVFAELFDGENATERDGFIFGALMIGGKRLRPLLVRLCAGFGEPNTNAGEGDIINIMVIIELMHSASLVHDDIVDRSPLRRSRVTINAQKGDGYAAMCGFSMVSSSLQLLNDIQNPDIPCVIAEIPKRMCEGEFLQFEIENRPDLQSEAEYYGRIERKTAALIEGSCVCGAMAAGAPESARRALSVYGKALGVLFQLRDDLLDCEQSPTDGKPISQDIERGVYSLPVLFAKEAAPKDDRLQTILRKHIKSPADISYLLDACRESGGIAYTQAAIRREAEKAEAALKALPQGAWTEALGLLLAALAGTAETQKNAKIVRMIP
ncbi:MAG: polyprenyl synthetase family protein [Clostridiales Family XIII bacterium]|jgi:geranylgeranyl pyrophosphate synthase|nr:polyprenyl synthetase family protein [Clostridiales Family XIII bacterium]